MSANQKQRTVRTAKRDRLVRASILQQFHCESVDYEFVFPIDAFNSKKFFKATGIKSGERWEATIRPRNRLSGYHVHFNGRLNTKNAYISIEYWDGALRSANDTLEPFAESLMSWIGSFVAEPSSHATIMARFEKPTKTWRSRFNLPFKVTMADDEVTIDGVSMVLPRNPFRAVSAFIARTEEGLRASVQLNRSLVFADFDLGAEVSFFNDALKIFMEHIA